MLGAGLLLANLLLLLGGYELLTQALRRQDRGVAARLREIAREHAVRGRALAEAQELLERLREELRQHIGAEADNRQKPLSACEARLAALERWREQQAEVQRLRAEQAERAANKVRAMAAASPRGAVSILSEGAGLSGALEGGNGDQ